MNRSYAYVLTPKGSEGLEPGSHADIKVRVLLDKSNRGKPLDKEDGFALKQALKHGLITYVRLESL